ncbi:Gfo/Idh/MocA family oxidoreductase [Sphingopyxis sp.]|jgi:predicted dehydrogenase|uniref:Gfo/Idh/MocA family protein n=1 Tax=Sphingopyxis sp. TaxID=1908224 RepID=UPI002DFAD4C0|nr:Gfo/Idh/MocA family oxidoreductase [Sphingopyxis sp.]
MTVIRWGMIGCGNVTERKSAPAYQQVDGFALHGIFNRTRAKAEGYAARHGVPRIFDSAADLIHAPDIDAVYIATPPDSHEAYAIEVARADKPCCIEKPIAPDHAACVRIRDAFAERGVPLFVAYYRRSLPRFRQVQSWIDEGAIGTVRHIHWTLTKPAGPADLSQDNWRVDANIAPGGYFDDLASHGLDLFCWLFGEVEEVAGFAVNQQGRYGAADAVTGCWLHKGGVTGSGSWNFGAAERRDRVEITGSAGRIVFSIFDEAPFRLTRGDESLESVIANPQAIQLFHVEAMRDHLAGRLIHPSTGDSGAHTAWVMDRILSRR